MITGVNARSMLPPGRVYSPLDARAVEMGAGVVETAFRKNGGFENIARPFHRFFAPAGRDRADQALKKALHMIVQDRLRILALRVSPAAHCGFDADPALPAAVHPLDKAAQAALGSGVRPRGAAVLAASFKMLLLIAARAARLLFRAVWTGVRYGRVSVVQTRSVLGAPGAMGMNGRGDWRPLEAAAREAGMQCENMISVIDETGDFEAPSPHPVIRIAQLPVPYAAWLHKAVCPSFRLAAALLPRAVTGFFNPWRAQLIYEALVMAEQSLPVRRLCMNYAFQVYLDVEEYAQRHIVKAMVLETAAGGRLVRWAHTVLNNAGVALDFPGYHDFLAFGPYERDSFSQHWLAGQRSVHIGMVKNDRRMASDDAASAHYRTLVEDHKKSGGRLLVYFLPSAMFGMDTVARRTLEAIVRQTALRRGWLLIVKPKGAGAHRNLHEYLRENRELISNGGANSAVFVEYEQDEKEVCGSGWLLRHLDLGVGFSTAQLEGLCLGKPVVQYYPVLQDTPFFARARSENLAFDDPAAFEAAAGQWMDKPMLSESAAAWGRRQFDPFGDDNALGRAAQFLFGAPA